ncbi:MAG: hypothetical protein KIS77_15195 [Saprospiraceae bacterium]|nr:hypothetical protein [Saprospiraceae bacterium]
MKNTKSLVAILPLSLSFFFACTNSDDNPSVGSDITPSTGQWKAGCFFDKKDETSNYAGYTFDFGANGSLSATNGSQT